MRIMRPGTDLTISSSRTASSQPMPSRASVPAAASRLETLKVPSRPERISARPQGLSKRNAMPSESMVRISAVSSAPGMRP